MKKSIKDLLESSEAAVIKCIRESALAWPAFKSEIHWMLLEYTLQHPFPPTIGLGQAHECKKESHKDEHPLVAYNNPDLELFSENDSLEVNFDEFEDLFDETNMLLEDKPYESSKKLVFKSYINICLALMETQSIKEKLILHKDFHVLARDFEECNEEEFLKKILPKPQVKKLLKDIELYNQRLEDEFNQDPQLSAIKEVLDSESKKYDELIENLESTEYETAYSTQDLYALKPYFFETSYHKCPKNLLDQLSTLKPIGTRTYYEYKVSNGKPCCVSYYSNDQLIFQCLFVHRTNSISGYKFFVNDRPPEMDLYETLTYENQIPLLYKKYSSLSFQDTTYTRDDNNRVIHAKKNHILFGHGFKNTTAIEYIFEYKSDDLFKISTVTQNGNKLVSFCADDSFMEEAINDFIKFVADFVIMVLKRAPDNVMKNSRGLIFAYEERLLYCPSIYLAQVGTTENITTYEYYDDNHPVMNLLVYTSTGASTRESNYFSREKCLEYRDLIYPKLCSFVRNRIKGEFNLDLEVSFKSAYNI